MRKTIISFDCDGTLIKDNDMNINERIVGLLKTLSSFKNVEIIVWSGRGEEWAELVVTKLGLTKYVDGVYSKNYMGKNKNGKHFFMPDIFPDICIDDIQDCELGLINLIVKEK